MFNDKGLAILIEPSCIILIDLMECLNRNADTNASLGCGDKNIPATGEHLVTALVVEQVYESVLVCGIYRIHCKTNGTRSLRKIKEEQILWIDFCNARRQLKSYPNDNILWIGKKMLDFILNINGFTCAGTTGIDVDVMFQNVFSFICVYICEAYRLSRILQEQVPLCQ